jgi:hypothetical protein
MGRDDSTTSENSTTPKRGRSPFSIATLATAVEGEDSGGDNSSEWSPAWQDAFCNLCRRFPTFGSEELRQVVVTANGHGGCAATALKKALRQATSAE